MHNNSSISTLLYGNSIGTDHVRVLCHFLNSMWHAGKVGIHLRTEGSQKSLETGTESRVGSIIHF
jgi:hypothetical protein